MEEKLLQQNMKDLGLVNIINGKLVHGSTVVLPHNIGGIALRTGQTYTINNMEYTIRVGKPTEKGIYAKVYLRK